MSDIPKAFTRKYYDSEYFVGIDGGKGFRRPNGSIEKWSYFNPDGEFLGARPIAKAWKEVFNPRKLLDVGCGRGTFIAYARDIGIEAEGFDYSEWAVSDEGRYPRCKAEWLSLHDATEPWLYEDYSFDLVVVLDLLEHIYLEDLDFVVDQMHRVSSKYLFLEIACVTPQDYGTIIDPGYALEKGKPVPIELECVAVAGHVLVQRKEWWIERLEHDDWWLRRDLEEWFRALVPRHTIQNWNTLLIYEYIG